MSYYGLGTQIYVTPTSMFQCRCSFTKREVTEKQRILVTGVRCYVMTFLAFRPMETMVLLG